MKAEHIADIVASKNAEIAALREVLDDLRWCQNYDEYRTVPTYFDCAFCGKEKSDPETHAPDCKIGRLFAKEESQHV